MVALAVACVVEAIFLAILWRIAGSPLTGVTAWLAGGGMLGVGAWFVANKRLLKLAAVRPPRHRLLR